MEEIINKLKNSELKAVEKATGIPYDRMRKWITANIKPKKEDYDKLVLYFEHGTNSNIKKDNSGISKYNTKDEAPYLEGVTASAGLEFLTNNGDVSSYIKIPGAGVEVYINVFGDSMYPKYCSGEIIGIKRVEKDMVFFGNAYVIEMKDGEAYIKYIYPGKDDNHWEFRSENPKHPSQQFHLNKINKVYKIKTTVTKNSL